jgi:citrate lyase subunit beta/citryl-CoA lyase
MGPRRQLLYVRVNAVDTEFCYGDEIAVVRPGLDGIILPKIETAVGVATIDWLLIADRTGAEIGAAID